jgi:hypothetical protein
MTTPVDPKTTTYNECRRNFGTEEMLAGLRAGRTLCVDRMDAPEWVELREWEIRGLVTFELVEIDEQSSVVRVRWVQGK